MVQVTLGRSEHEDLQALRDLLSHKVPSGDLNQVLAYAIRVARLHAEKKRFAVTETPRAPRGNREGSRAIPAHIQRTVRQRDGSQCTFVGEDGQRCTERRFLEFDHVEPFARVPKTTVENLRLRCRAHNQYEAERAFGADFMEAKREASRRAQTPTAR